MISLLYKAVLNIIRTSRDILRTAGDILRTAGDILRTAVKIAINPLGLNPISDILKDLEKSETTIDIKIQKVNESLIETSQIIKELETEFNVRSRKLELLQREYTRYSELAVIEKEKVTALLEQVDHSVNKGKRSERWASFWISSISGIIIFVLGLILSPILTPLFSKLLKLLNLS